MDAPGRQPSKQLLPLFLAWFGLIALTLFSLTLGEWFEGSVWLPALVSAIIWIKAWLVAFYFLEVTLATKFIRRLVWVFIAFAPIALTLIDFYGREFAALMQL